MRCNQGKIKTRKKIAWFFDVFSFVLCGLWSKPLLKEQMASSGPFDILTTLTPEKRDLVGKLREVISKDAHYSGDEAAFCASNLTLFRYLEARDWRLEDARKMLAATLKWRKGTCVFVWC
jgi:hypothetical protein